MKKGIIMDSKNIRKEIARNLSMEAIKQRGMLNKTDWTPETIVEELEKMYKSFYDALENKDITKC